MKKAWIAVAAVALLALPVSAVANGGKKGDKKNAARYCKSLRAETGADAFRSAFGGGKNAFGKCVSMRAHQLKAARKNARRACKEQFKSQGKKFRNQGAPGGDNPSHGRGQAFKQCVKDKLAQTTGDDQQNVVDAVKQCVTERDADPAAFVGKYSPDDPGEALGHCVREHLAQPSGDTQPGGDTGAQPGGDNSGADQPAAPSTV